MAATPCRASRRGNTGWPPRRRDSRRVPMDPGSIPSSSPACASTHGWRASKKGGGPLLIWRLHGESELIQRTRKWGESKVSKGHSQEPKAESRKPGRIRSFDAWSLEPGARSRLSEVRSQRSEALVLALAMLACASLSFAQQPQPVQQSPAQQPPVAGVVVLTDDASGLRVQQPVAPQQ